MKILIPRKNQDVSLDVSSGTTPWNDVDREAEQPRASGGIRIYCRAKEIEGGTRRRDLRHWRIYDLGEPTCQTLEKGVNGDSIEWQGVLLNGR